MIEETNGGTALPFLIGSSEKLLKKFRKNSERVRKEFGKELARAFEVIALHPDYTAEQIASEMDKSARTVEKYIAKLKEAGILIRKGPKLGGYWKIVEPK